MFPNEELYFNVSTPLIHLINKISNKKFSSLPLSMIVCYMLMYEKSCQLEMLLLITNMS